MSQKTLGDKYEGINRGEGNIFCIAGGENDFLISVGDVLYRYNLTSQNCVEELD